MNKRQTLSLFLSAALCLGTAACAAPAAPSGASSGSQSPSQGAPAQERPAPLTQASVVSKKPAAADYPDFFAAAQEAFLIPGLENSKLVPQGMCCLPGRDMMVISYYTTDKSPSILALVELSTGKLLKAVTLANEDGTPYIGHAGGLAATEKSLWCVTGGDAQRLEVQDLLAAEDMSSLGFKDRFATGTRASLSAISDGILWVGDFFTAGGNYDTDKSHHTDAPDGSKQHAWIVGFVLDPSTPNELKAANAKDPAAPVVPDYILSVPDKIQGLARLTDGRFVLSESYGRKNPSHLLVYRDVLKDAPVSSAVIGGAAVPMWYLDVTTQEGSLELPPMSEALEQWEGKVCVLFESGAKTYRDNALDPTDFVWEVTFG